MALLEHVNNGYWANIFGLAFGIAIYLLFSLPFALLGLLPVALFGEVLARKTRMHPIAIAVVAAVASVPIALWMTPGVRLPYRAFVGVGFGLVVTASWVLLSFRTDGFAAILESADRA